MPALDPIDLRAARRSDALRLSVLGMQVFLDTYATGGIRETVAREVASTFAVEAMQRALDDPRTIVVVAERDAHLLGFAQITGGAAEPLAPPGVQAELLRLYVQEPFTGQGLGTRLLRRAEAEAARTGATVLWLTPWVHNHRALAFYKARGYRDYGTTWYRFEDEQHENRVLALQLGARRAVSAT